MRAAGIKRKKILSQVSGRTVEISKLFDNCEYIITWKVYILNQLLLVL
jgi:hypothetical protein